eukprot:g22695.t1
MTSVVYPMPFEQERFQKSYLCPEGTSLLSLTCQPCRAGYYRREGMLHCQDCPSGYFQDLAGASGCLRCPPVSTSCDSSTLPKLEEGHFTFTDSYSFLSNNSGYPALRDFVFDFVGTFNLTNTNDVATADCKLAQSHVTCPMKLNLSSLSPALSGQFPVPNFGLEYAKCFVPKPCAGDTSCTTAYNFGLFCSQCIPGYSFDGVFPASRLCSKCPSSAVVQVRTVVILLLMALFMLAVARSATDVAKGSLSLVREPAQSEDGVCYL